jgi:putative inorganic carbon (hco3(-)) transporter
MKAGRSWLAAGFTVAVLAAAAVLVFSTALPTWMASAATLFMVLAFLARGVATRHLLGHTPADLPLLALLLLLPVGLWASPDPGITYPRTDALVASAALFWVVAAQHDRFWLRHSGWALLAGGAALALVVFTATPFPAKLPIAQIDISALQGRLQTPFLRPDEFNPNLTGHVMALLLAPAVALALKGSSRSQRVAALLVSVLLAALLVLSQSRGALLASLVAIPVVTVAINWRWLWLWGPLGLLGLGAALAIGPSLDAAALAVDAGSVNTLQGRAELWSRALYLMQDFPFTGVGLGMPEPVIKLLYPTFLTGPDSVWFHVHNTYLQVGSEMGVPGLIAFLALLLTVAAVLVRQVRRARRAGVYQGLSVGLLGSWSVFVVHSLVDTPTFSPIIGVSFFVLLGLMVAVATSTDAGKEVG